MNKLSRKHTSKFFASKEEYVAFRKHWSALINSDRKHELKAEHHLLYLVLCGKDWRKAFSLPTNMKRMQDGYIPAIYRAQQRVLYQRTVQIFDGFVSQEVLSKAGNLIKQHVVEVDKQGNYTVNAYPDTISVEEVDCV